MNKHTELPWTFGFDDGSGKLTKRNGDYYSQITFNNQVIATVWDDDAEFEPANVKLPATINAAYIVKACNLFPELVEILEGIIDEADNHGGGSDTMSEVLLEIQRSAKNILKKAKE